MIRMMDLEFGKAIWQYYLLLYFIVEVLYYTKLYQVGQYKVERGRRYIAMRLAFFVLCLFFSTVVWIVE